MKSPKVVVSACLLGKKCRYDGRHCYSEKVKELVGEKEVILVCPEVRGGLSVPREPVEIQKNRVMTKEGCDKTEEYQKGVDLTLEDLAREEIAFAILKSKSPSCGVHHIYDGEFRGRLIKGEGLLAKALRKMGVELVEA